MRALSPPNLRRISIEGAVVVAGLTTLVAGVMWASGTMSRLSHPLWLDESITALVASDSSLSHAIRAIRGGVENNPPTYYLALWPIVHLCGGLGAVGLRIIAGVSMILGLAGVYAVCRLSLTMTQAVIGCLVVAAHPMIVAQMFEARFYGAWFAATMWFAFAVLARADSSRALTVVRCVLGIIVATVHWFGIAIVGMIVTSDTLRTRDAAVPRWLRTLPFVCAVGAMTACLPFLADQRSGLSVLTWIDPVTPLMLARLIYRIFWNVPMLVAAVCVGWRIASGRQALGELWAGLVAFAPVLSLLAFPVVIILFSLVVQPSLVERYLLAVVAPLGVIAAAAAMPVTHRGGRLLSALSIVALVVALGREMRANRRLNSISDWRMTNAAVAAERIIANGGPLPVVFARRFEQYPALEMHPEIAASVALLDFDGTPDASLAPLTLFERDMGRKVNRLYPRYRLVSAATLQSGGPFVVITNSDEVDELRRLLPGFEIVRQAPDVFYLSPGNK